MNLIIGGAYQGKLDYAKKAYNLKDDDVFVCKDAYIDFNKPCIMSLEKFAYACTQSGVSAVEFFKKNREQWLECVLICEDIFCGVVPLGAEQRAWRQETGLLCQYLSWEAESVTRVFCGLPQKLK